MEAKINKFLRDNKKEIERRWLKYSDDPQYGGLEQLIIYAVGQKRDKKSEDGLAGCKLLIMRDTSVSKSQDDFRGLCIGEMRLSSDEWLLAEFETCEETSQRFRDIFDRYEFAHCDICDNMVYLNGWMCTDCNWDECEKCYETETESHCHDMKRYSKNAIKPVTASVCDIMDEFSYSNI